MSNNTPEYIDNQVDYWEKQKAYAEAAVKYATQQVAYYAGKLTAQESFRFESCGEYLERE